MGLSTGKGKIYVIDDSEIKMYNANQHFWLEYSLFLINKFFKFK